MSNFHSISPWIVPITWPCQYAAGRNISWNFSSSDPRITTTVKKTEHPCKSCCPRINKSSFEPLWFQGLTKATIDIPVDSRGNRHFDSNSNLGGNGAPRLWAFKIMSYYQVLHIGCQARGLLYHKHSLLVWECLVLSGNVDKYRILITVWTVTKRAFVKGVKMFRNNSPAFVLD